MFESTYIGPGEELPESVRRQIEESKRMEELKRQEYLNQREVVNHFLNQTVAKILPNSHSYLDEAKRVEMTPSSNYDTNWNQTFQRSVSVRSEKFGVEILCFSISESDPLRVQYQSTLEGGHWQDFPNTEGDAREIWERFRAGIRQQWGV
jgi:hypothetical protein